MWSCMFLLLAASSASAAIESFRVVYEWYKVDFTWNNDEHKLEAYTKKRYEPRNNVIENVRVWEDVAFLSLPRSKSGVPATLVTVPSAPEGPSASPRLRPFPDWSFQEVGRCDHLQNVRALEVDPDGFLWVADSGVVGEFREYSEPDNKCPPKIVIFDIKTRTRVSEYEFSRELLPSSSVLSDIVLDPRGSKTAYISVVSESESFVVVYQNQTRSAVKVKLVGFPEVKMTSVVVNGTEVPMKLNKLSLALSLKRNTLYLNPSWQETLFSADLKELQSSTSSTIRRVGKLPGLSYTLSVDSQDSLYFSVLEGDAVGKWNTSQKFDSGSIVARDHSFLQFPSSFALDKFDTFWIVSNRLQTYFNNDVNLEVPNFRLLRAYSGTKSYLYASTENSSGKLSVSSFMFVLLFLIVLR
ncbi:major royal jelly protein 1-like [Macrosteles quadrilineatus]|uniref:major royal jelly protein 1-like n=1 Tax=Macrosteles quadrilineatus TaxID=74068 RepID=UPI0023E2F3A4|nr:major royal jelly protein 1-like [Macrosteles quadrilineatus]